ncbi:MAG: response regulator [Nitrospirae bacterium]|nr:response regulator [Nitrospirota bacterium]
MFKIKFLRNILLISLAIAIILPLYNVLFIYPSFNKLMMETVKDQAFRVTTHLGSMFVPEKSELKRESLPPNFANEVRLAAKDFGLIKLKLFSKAGEVIFSTDETEIGEMNRKRYFHEIVARGNTYTNVVPKTQRSAEGKIVTVDVVETYVPIIREEGFVGAFEIYFDITGAKGKIGSLISHSYAVLFVLAFGLLTAIFLVLSNAKKTIGSREKAERGLVEKQKDLEAISNELKADRDQLRSSLNIFSRIITEVEKKKGFETYLYRPIDNPHIATCWEVKNCKYKDCPVFGQRNIRCWQIAGTHCGGNVQGVFAKKFGACEKCSIYQDSIKDPMYEIWETFNNMMHILESTHKELIDARFSAEDASRLKSDFLANMSHEIRTPMTGVIGMIDLALNTNLTEGQRDYLITAKRNAYELLEIINDILDFSKIEAGMLPVDIIDFNLRMTVESVAETLAPRAQEKNLELACLIHHTVPSLVRGDSGRIRQILVNLAGNAIKFTEKGEVVIRVELKQETDDKVTVLFSVTDTGIGISKDKLSMIFAPFTQADTSTTRKYGGTGLGLSISMQLVRLMGGELSVESEGGKGSRFWFTVPLEKQKAGDIITHEVYPDIHGAKILVADDNETNRTILCKMLEGFGCRPYAVEDDIKAVQELKNAAGSEDPFRLLILDMQIPGTDTTQVIRNIKKSSDINKTAIIALTSLASRGDSAQLHEMGCDGYLVKPIKQSMLLDAITTVLSPEAAAKDLKHKSIVTRHTISEKKRRDVRILLVEDNPVNQKFITALLNKAGYTADVAGNGRLAVEAAAANEYDLILMDVQMPEMDGFEATKAIRGKEGESRHTPIIAMTAHAMEGDREACINAGMDDYISKPIQPPALFVLIEKWIKTRLEKKSAGPELVITDDNIRLKDAVLKSIPVDMKSAMQRFGNDREFFKEMLKEFLNYIPEHLKTLSEAAASGDADVMQIEAHSIKGAAGNLSADKVYSLALSIEHKARDRSISDASLLINELKDEVDRLNEFATAL